MAITINGQIPSYYGVTVAGWSENTLTASILTLDTVVDSYKTTTPLLYGDTVTVLDGSAQLFTGTVTMIPTEGSGTNHGQSYEVSDGWACLEQIVMQTERVYPIPDGEGGTTQETKLFSVVSYEKDQSMGERITDVLNYAISKGANLQIGTIAAGIDWWRSEYKNQACSEVLRDIMRTMPDYQLYVDVRTSPATISMKLRSDLDPKTVNLTGGKAVSHSHTDLNDQIASSVILRYEFQNTVDDETFLTVVEDSAGGNDGAKGTVIESIEMAGSSANYEYSPVTAEEIPDEMASEAEKVTWWVNHTPALKLIADEYGIDFVVPLLDIANFDNIPEDIHKHKLFLQGEPERPEPINPNATPITPSEELTDYPNELIEGGVTEWMRKRYRMVNAVASLAIKDVMNDNISDVVSALYGIMKRKQTWAGDDLRICKVEGAVMATNARTKNYRRLVSSTPAEEMPVGLAAQILAQFSQLRRRGSITLKDQGIDNQYRIGQSLNLSNGKTAWASMDESIVGVSHDLASGNTTIEYGPTETMGAQDFIERLRASRRNVYVILGGSGSSAEANASGGTVATPSSRFTLTSEAGTDKPFLLTARRTEAGVYKYKVSNETSSVVDRTASVIDISEAGFNEEKDITGIKYIVLEFSYTDKDAEGNGGGVRSGPEILGVDKADSVEIDYHASGLQSKARLIIGKVETTGGNVVATQHVETCQMLHDMFDNGQLVKGFISYPFTD